MSSRTSTPRSSSSYSSWRRPRRGRAWSWSVIRTSRSTASAAPCHGCSAATSPPSTEARPSAWRIAGARLAKRSTPASDSWQPPIPAASRDCCERRWCRRLLRWSSLAKVVRFLVGYLESLRKPDDPDAFDGALASSLGGVGARTLGRLRASARERSRPLLRVVRRLMYSLAARDAKRYPLPWGEAAPVQEPGQERPEPDYMAFLSDDELS